MSGGFLGRQSDCVVVRKYYVPLDEAEQEPRQWSYGPTTSDQMVRKGRQQLLNADPLIIRGDYLACDKFDMMDRVSATSLPTLIICGSADQMTPPEYSHHLRDQIRAAQLVRSRGPVIWWHWRSRPK